MTATNYKVNVIVDVNGKKVMDELAKGSGSSNATGDKKKTFDQALGQAKTGVMKGEGIGNIFSTLTAAITPLTAVLGVGVGILLMALSNSKILTTFMGTIGKLLGFLVDIIFLPLMPFFMQLVRFLYQMIIAFRNFTKNLSLESILKFGIDVALITSPIGWVVKLIQWAVGDGNIATALKFTTDVLEGIGGWLWGVVKWMLGVNVGILKTVLGFTMDIGSQILGALTGLADLAIWLLKWIFGMATVKNTTLSLDFVANLVGDAWKTVQAVAGDALSTGASIIGGVGSFLGFRAGGGPVSSGGSYVVGERGPELFTPSSSGTISPNGGGNTYIFQNYGQTKTELELFGRFMDLMRQKGRGLTL